MLQSVCVAIQTNAIMYSFLSDKFSYLTDDKIGKKKEWHLRNSSAAECECVLLFDFAWKWFFQKDGPDKMALRKGISVFTNRIMRSSVRSFAGNFPTVQLAWLQWKLFGYSFSACGSWAIGPCKWMWIGLITGAPDSNVWPTAWTCCGILSTVLAHFSREGRLSVGIPVWILVNMVSAKASSGYLGLVLLIGCGLSMTFWADFI